MEGEWESIERLMHELIEDQKAKLLALGRRFIPTLTSEDILQPIDYPELENHPHFRYEEGILAGMQTMEIALRALMKDRSL